MNLTGLHLLLSYRCTFECDHCFVWSSPRAEGTMSLAFIRNVLRQARNFDSIREIFFEGGEPCLFHPILLAAVHDASAHGFDTVGVVTNGYFATTVEDAVEWLRPLVDAGMTTLSISDDTFHSGESGGLTDAGRTLEAAKRLKIDVDTICIEPAGTTWDPKVPGTPILGGGVRFRGRAVTTLLDPSLPRRPWESFTECPDEDFVDVGRLHLDAYGNLFACQGVVIGNLNRESLAETVDAYEPDRHPIVGPLMHGGPAELVRRFNLPLRGTYVDACHLCYLARDSLRERYPDLLAPPQVFGEE